MALPVVTTRERVTLVCLADPEVRLLPGLKVSPIYLYPSSAVVVEGDEATAGKGATRIIVRGLADLELARVSGQGSHTLFIGAGKAALIAVRNGDWESLPYAVKHSVGQWVTGEAQGYPLRAEPDEATDDDASTGDEEGAADAVPLPLS